MPEPGVVLVGGGECAVRAAVALRRRGWSGPVTVVGREPTLAYERPPLSKGALTHGAAPVHPHGYDELSALGIRVMTGTEVEAVVPDQQAVVLDQGVLRYRHLVLATGARPRLLPFPGVLHLRTHADAVRLRSRLRSGRWVLVVGAGLIGLEVAASARALGCDVTVVESGERAAARAVPARLAEQLVSLHRARGVSFRWASTVTGVRAASGRSAVTFSTGETLVFDVVVAGIGVVPETSLAESAGLRVADGIVTDEWLRTSAPDVHAAGDCASVPQVLLGGERARLESWRNALDQADRVAATITGAAEPHRNVPWFWSDQYDHTLQVAGLPFAAHAAVRRDTPGATMELGLDTEGRLVSAAGLGPGNAVARDIRAAELLIGDGAAVDPDLLADASVPLAKVLAATRATSPVRARGGQ